MGYLLKCTLLERLDIVVEFSHREDLSLHPTYHGHFRF